MRIEFKLSMPNVGSWNGRWTGQDRNYVHYRNIPKDIVSFLGLDKKEGYWHYNFGDGWSAGIRARVMETGKKEKKSDGFYGYEWMIDSIIKINKIVSQQEVANVKSQERGK